MSHNRFFRNEKPSVSQKKRHAVDLGGGGNFFLSTAAGIVDDAITIGASKSEFQIQLAIFEKHFDLPFTVSKDASQETLQYVQSSPIKMAQFVKQFALALRKETVGIMKRDPETYQNAFITPQGTISAQTLCEEFSWVHECAINALEQVIKKSINLKETASEKNIFSRKKPFSSNAICISRQDQYYYAEVNNPLLFIAVNNQHEPVEAVVSSDMPNIISSIKNGNKAIVETYDDHVKRLSKAVEWDGLGKEKLLEMYYTGIKYNQKCRVGCEKGDQQYFENIKQTLNGGTNLRALNGNASNDDTINRAIHAIARSISLGNRSAEEVYQHLDEPKNPGVSN